MTTYLPLSSADDVGDNKDEHFLASLSDPTSVPWHVRAPPHPPSSRRTRLLVATNVLTALLALALAALPLLRPPPPDPTHATGFPAARHLAGTYAPRDFTGALLFNESTMTMERQTDPNVPAYFGPLSPAIDAAWKDLLRGEFFVMTAAEAAPFEPDLRPFARDGKRRMELQVTHDLHCLNAVRRALDREHYGDYHGSALLKQMAPNFARDHVDHCLHLLMQSLMCHADLTPAPLYTWPHSPIALGRGATHTCRDWSAVRAWYDERNRDGSAMDPE